MKIAELARRAGISAHSLRYYERIGLMPPAPRDGSGHRDYDAAALVWLTFIGHMKAAGMPIREMLAYARLRQQGEATASARAGLLRARRAAVAARISELGATLSVLDDKITAYERKPHDNDPA